MLFDEIHEKGCGGVFMLPGKHFAISSYIFNAGSDLKDSSDYSWDGLKRGSVEFGIWQYTISGCGMLDYEGKTYKIMPGQAMFVRVPHAHRYYYSPITCDPWRFIFVSLGGREVMRTWREIEKKYGFLLQFGENSKTLQTYMEIYRLIPQSSELSKFQNSWMAYKFMMSICDDLTPGGETYHSTQPDFMRKAVKFIYANIGRALTVDEIAEHVGLSRFHFSRLFNKYQGVPPAMFIRTVRLELSYKTLQFEQNLTVKEIAEKCGFTDSSHFCKEFKDQYGYTPGFFRTTKLM